MKIYFPFFMSCVHFFPFGIKLTDMYDGVKIMKNRAYNYVIFITSNILERRRTYAGYF